jgi:hypothetical protein
MFDARYSAVVLLALTSVAGCDDSKAAQQKAAEVAAKLQPGVTEDVAQIRRGLPDGATKLGALLDSDPGANLAGLQRAIQQARGGVRELDMAKSTFFSFADPNGVVLRSEADPDLLANHKVTTVFPALSKALEPSGGVVEAFGEMEQMRGYQTGADQQWVVAHAVKDASGTVKGMFVTGWSFRRYAAFLQEQAKRDLIEAAEKEKKKAAPLVYVFMVKGQKAYAPGLTPEVDTEAVQKLDLVSKTAAGPYQGSLEITGRPYGVAARRTPELGDDAAVAVIVSEI